MAYQANARQGTRAQKDRGEVKPLDQEAVPPEGVPARPRRHDPAAVAWGGRIFPNRPDENFAHKVNKKMYRAGMARSCRSWRATAASRGGRSIAVEAPKTKLLAARSSRPWAWTRSS